MFRQFLNGLLANGLWFAAVMLNLLSAAITTLSVTVVAVIVKWVNIKL